jgi:hypothetical protein
MASFFEDLQEKQKKKRKTTTLLSAVKTATQKAQKTAEQKKTAAKPTTGKSNTTTTKTSNRASALVDRHTDSKGRLYSPLDYMLQDAKNGNTVKTKVATARASGLAKGDQKAWQESKRQQQTQRIKAKQEQDKQKLSRYDSTKLNKTGKQLVREAKVAWNVANDMGDEEGMARAHQKAESARAYSGYSGGSDGSQYIRPETGWEDKVAMNQMSSSIQRQLNKARMDYETAKQGGDKEGMKAAIRRETEIRRSLRQAGALQSQRTDANGRSMWSGSKEDAQREAEQMAAGFKAAGTGMAGSVLSLIETAAKSTDNYVLDQNRDYIEKTANDLNLWKARLELAQQGQGDPAWGTIEQLEQRVRIAENMDKLRSASRAVDPNAAGQQLMRKSQEYTEEATRGMTWLERFLTEAGISIGQNLPGMAAAAIPVVGPAVGATLMGAQAAGAKAFELNERGIAPDEALQRGLIYGGIELATERIPLGSLAKLLGGKSGANAAKNILKQMGIEASEESASYVANYMADKIAKDPEAEWSWQELLENAAAGAVSGGVFGTAGSMIGELRQNATGTNVQNRVEDVERTVGIGVNRKTMEEIDQVSRLLGVQTRFADQVAGGLANAELRGNTITIERNNPNPVRFLYGHEITHRMQAVSPEGYAQFRDIIAREEGVKTQVEEVLREAGEMGLPYSRDQAMDEVAADYAGALIENERLLQKFIRENQENKTLLQRMSEAFRELLDKLRGRDTTKIENAVEALELAMKETVKGSRLLTGREAAVKARRTAQEERFLSNRRDDLMGQVIRDYQEGNLEAAARAEVDRAGVETLVDGYLSGKQNPRLAEFNRRMQAYEDGAARYSFKRAGDTVARQARQMEEQGGNAPSQKRTEPAPERPAQDARDTAADSVQTGDAATFKTGATAEAVRLPGDAESPPAASLSGTEGESNVKSPAAGQRSYEGRELASEKEIYGYDFLTALPDMKTTILPEVDAVRGVDGRVDTGKTVAEGMKNARSAGTERDGKVFVRNSYTGRQLQVTAKSIRHGLNGSMNRLLTNARLGAVIGDVVKNAVPINALYNKAKGVTGTYAMAGYATDSKGREFVAIITVEQYDGNVTGIEVYDVTHAASGRQKNASPADTVSQGFYPSTAGTISIQNFLDVVNTTHQSILSDDVLSRLGETRNPGGFYTGQVKFSNKKLSSYERAYETVYGKPLEPPKTVKESAEQAYVGIIDRLQRMEVPKPKERKVPPLPSAENKPLVKPSEIHEETVSAEDLAYMDELMDAAEEGSASGSEKQDKKNDRLIEEAERLIQGGVEEKATLKDQVKDVTGFAYRKLVDSGEEIRKAGKQSGDKYLYSYYNQAKASTAIAQNMISMRQSDVNGKEVGESLVSIFGPIKKKGTEYFKDFESYLLHRHNVDRMGTKEDLQMLTQAKRYLKEFDRDNPEIASMSRDELEHAARNGGELAKERLDMLEEKARWESIVKPVFGYQVTAEISQGRAKELEGLHPEFKELAERVYGYSRNLMQYRVDSGLIDQRTADYLQRRYPHYVPTFRRQDGVNTAKQEKGVRVGKTVKRAKGSDAPLMDIDKAMAQQTMNTVREGSKNRFGQRLLSDKISQDYVINVQSVAAQKQKLDLEEAFRNEQTAKDNTFTVYQDGKAYEITLTPEMFEGVKGLTPTGENDKRAMKAVIAANNIYKKTITSWNPIFTLKNWLKDFQDALLYTTDIKGFAKNYFGPALKQIATNGDEWKIYQALGGAAASVYNSEKGVELPKDSKLAKLVGKISAINLAVEQWPRLAEFMATAQKGNRTQEELMEAMYNAADITTNFGRSGQATKWLNATFVPFLNPSIQGFDKLVRTFKDNDRTVKAWVALGAKCAVFGVAPAIINAALFGGEDDYEELNQRDLDGNFMIPMRIFSEEWDGMWLKVPRGRALAAMGAVANAGINLAKGKEVDAGELIDTVWTNVGVINPLSGHILKSWSDAALFDEDNPGKTWYGSDIETTAMQNKKPGERYNERTDKVSKAIGGALGLSPAKINYLLDSYTGVFGDLALPLLTPTNPVGKNPLAKSFVVDSTTSNRLSGEFYDLGDELKYAEQDGSAEATIAYDYWNKVSQELSDVNEDIRKMENDLSLDSKDKRKKYRDLKAKANEIIRAGMKNVGAFQKAAAQYAGEINEDTEQDIFLKVTREVLGAQTALEYEGKDTYEKAQSVVEEGGSYDSYYDYLQMERTLGKVLDANSKLNKLNERGITGDTLTEAQTIAEQLTGENQDLMEKSLTGSNGWKPTEGDRKLSILESMNLPEEEAFAIWKMKILDDDGRWNLKVMEEAGLPEIEYYRYKMAVKHLNGKEDPNDPGTTLKNSKKNQRLPVINSLNLTTKQKDLLWFDNDWKKSTLWQAPWH